MFISVYVLNIIYEDRLYKMEGILMGIATREESEFDYLSIEHPMNLPNNNVIKFEENKKLLNEVELDIRFLREL